VLVLRRHPWIPSHKSTKRLYALVGIFLQNTIDQCKKVTLMEMPCISWSVGCVHSIVGNSEIHLLAMITTWRSILSSTLPPSLT
jgi:hypothetical protein